MDCIYCSEKTRTVNSRKRSKGLQVWRRHKCVGCGAVFTSNELVDLSLAIRVKKISRLEPFNYEKLLLSIYGSLSHRKTALADAKELTDTIILNLLPCKNGIILASMIKESAQKALARFDKASGTYYQAHYQESN